MSTTKPRTKIPIVQIIIERAEGLAADMGTHTFSTFAAAEAYLKKACQDRDPKRLGADKCDFRLCFADGETYEGHFSIAHPHSNAYEGSSISEHVRLYLTYCAGLAPRKGQSEEDYVASLNRLRENDPKVMDRSLHFLKTYDLNDAPVNDRQAVPVADVAQQIVTEVAAKQAATEFPGQTALRSKHAELAVRLAVEQAARALTAADELVEHLKRTGQPYAEAQTRAMTVRKALGILTAAKAKP